MDDYFEAKRAYDYGPLARVNPQALSRARGVRPTADENAEALAYAANPKNN
jgi:hypothetical protein